MPQRSGSLVVLSLLLACTSRSPFTRSPAEIAINDPCRFMGTFHKESRSRIESLRMCHAITREEWSCMTDVLKALDDDFTGICRERRASFDEIAGEQRRRYAACLSPARPGVVDCAILGADPACLAERCP